jgi:hypothetical protein
MPPVIGERPTQLRRPPKPKAASAIKVSSKPWGAASREAARSPTKSPRRRTRAPSLTGLFLSDDLGPIPGALPISAIDLKGSAVTPLPAIVVNFRTFSTGCANPFNCGVEIADTGLQQGQGMHGSFSRADTVINAGAIGPDFRRGFADDAPMSNADLGKTMTALLHLHIPDTGKLAGRVLAEAMPNGPMPAWRSALQVSQPDKAGRRTVVQTQIVGNSRYFDAAGYPGRTLGLSVPESIRAAGE